MLRHAHERRAPIVVLQPTVVYGPFAGWTLGPIRQLRDQTVVLPNDGRGVCNAVYLDDVVQAIMRAAVAPDIDGEVFLISGDPAPTWRAFYGAYEAMLGVSSIRGMDAAAIHRHLKAQAKAARPIRRILDIVRADGALRQAVLSLPGLSLFYSAVQLALPQEQMEHVKDRLMNRKAETAALSSEKPLLFPSSAQLGIMASSARVCIDKARRLIGFDPGYNLETGMRATREWVEWARLL
jgi:nucleoside-diphosphate-sugar epimerase